MHTHSQARTRTYTHNYAYTPYLVSQLLLRNHFELLLLSIHASARCMHIQFSICLSTQSRMRLNTEHKKHTMQRKYLDQEDVYDLVLLSLY